MKRRDFVKAAALLAGLGGSGLLRPSRVLSAPGESVIVIGAGMSGVAAANLLVANGYQVTVLEGRSRMGGRTFTDTSLGVPIDLGGAWIEGVSGNPLTTLAAQFGVSTFPDVLDTLYFNGKGKPVRFSEVRKARKSFNSIVRRTYQLGEELDEDIAFGTLMNREISAAKKRGEISRKELQIIKYLLNATITGDIAADPKYVSTWWVDDDEAFDGAEHLLPGGYVQLINGLASGLNIQLEHRVTRVDYSDTGVTVETNQGSFSADRCIVTLPLGVLKSGNVQFSPALPEEKLSAISRLDMGLLNKVVMRFEEAFWEIGGKELSGFAQLKLGRGENAEIPDFVDLAPVVGAPVLLGIFGGDFARYTESLSESDLVGLAMKTLRRIFGNEIPSPGLSVRSAWMTDPFCYGAYSYIPVGAHANDRTILGEPVGNSLLFAGEATTREYPATVHGAYLSGIREATRIIEN